MEREREREGEGPGVGGGSMTECVSMLANAGTGPFFLTGFQYELYARS